MSVWKLKNCIKKFVSKGEWVKVAELAKVGHAAQRTHTSKINKVIEEFLDGNQ